jgi:thioredoxin-related protein
VKQSRRPHPHFDDRDTLDWHTEWAEALESARAEGRLIVVEFGREQCSNCRALVSNVVPHPRVAPLLQQHFVALASDCDEPEDEVVALAEHLEDASMLPFVMFADSDGKFLDGCEGAQSAAAFLTRLERLVAQKR